VQHRTVSDLDLPLQDLIDDRIGHDGDFGAATGPGQRDACVFAAQRLDGVLRHRFDCLFDPFGPTRWRQRSQYPALASPKLRAAPSDR
jgi:hypothetical protein